MDIYYYLFYFAFRVDGCLGIPAIIALFCSLMLLGEDREEFNSQIKLIWADKSDRSELYNPDSRLWHESLPGNEWQRSLNITIKITENILRSFPINQRSKKATALKMLKEMLAEVPRITGSVRRFQTINYQYPNEDPVTVVMEPKVSFPDPDRLEEILTRLQEPKHKG